MRYWLFKAAVGFLLAWIAGSGALAQQPPTADAVFRLSAARGPDGALLLNWAIAPGNYLYRDKITVANSDGTMVATGTPPGEMKDDPSFGQTEVYHREAKALVPAAVLDGSPVLQVSYQGCAEQGICYPPIRKTIDTTSMSVSDSNLSSRPASAIKNSWTSDLTIDPPQPGGNDSAVAQSGQTDLHGSIGSMLLAFVGFGLLLAFTPCTFPMIPILSGMLAQSGKRLTARRGFVLSGAYVLAMALAYAALGVVVAWSGQNLQAVLQTPIALGLMSAVFVALALSMFGLYDLQLPQSWQSRLMGRATRRGGSLGGAAIMGFASALIVGPCVTPPLAAALVYVAQTGDVLRGALALFALGLGMGLPLLAFGTFGAGILPASGPWLARVKYVFGFVFIGLAIWMLARVIPQWSVLLLTGVACAAAGGLLIASQLRASGSRPGWRAASAALGLLVLGSGGYLTIASVNGPDRLLRLTGLSTPASAATASFETVTTPEELDHALETARRQGKPVMLDFSAEWCVECKVTDRTVFSDPEVQKHLQDFALIRADATDYNEDTRSLMKRFGVVGPPTIIFLGPHRDTEVPDTRLIGAVDAKTFSSRLQQLRPI